MIGGEAFWKLRGQLMTHRDKHHNYTVYEDERINAKVSSDLQYIVGEILSLLANHVYAIVLEGGFGRGEGGVVVEKNGEIRAINDYDIMVIIKKRYLKVLRKNKSKLETLAARAARKIRIKQVDIFLVSLKQLRVPRNTVHRYELINGHQVLYGHKDLSRYLDHIDPVCLPLTEGTQYFHSRGTGLLIAIRILQKNKDLKDAAFENFVIEMIKAILAMGDSILLLKERYHYSFKNRISTIQEIDVTDIPLAGRIVPNYLQALEDKLMPNFSKYRQINLFKWCCEIQSLFQDFFLFFERKRLKLNFADWYEYSQKRTDNNRLNFRHLAKVALNITNSNGMRLRNILMRNNLAKMRAIMALLLFSIRDSEINATYLHRAEELLDYRNSSSDLLTRWESAVDAYLHLWQPTVTKLLSS